MRIAVIDPSCLTWPYTPRLCAALTRKGCEVDLIASRFLYSDNEKPTAFGYWEHFYQRTVRLYRGRTKGRLRQYIKGAEHVVDMLHLPQLLKSMKPDVIHYQQAPVPWIDRWFLPGLKRLAPLVLTVHNTIPFHGDGHWFLQMGFKPFLSHFAHFIVHTEYSRRRLVEGLRLKNRAISFFQHPLFDLYENPAETTDRSAARISTTEGEAVVLFFGNISQYKGLDILIRALGKLPPHILSRTRLLVAGNPQIPIKSLKKLATLEGISDRITWELGYVPEGRINSLFRCATVVALPYRHIDGSGVFTLALHHEKPVIASNIGSFGEFIKDGVHGCLVEPEDPNDLAHRLTWMLSDPSRLIEMGQSVRALRHSWPSWDDMASKTIQIYHSLLTNPL